MSRGLKIGLGVGVVALVVGGMVMASVRRRNAGTEVRMEQVARRDLVATVTASGNIEAQSQVDISADVTGRILDIAVKEGDLVKKGQFLIQIDPAQFEGAVARSEAALASNQASLVQAQANRDQALRELNRARELQRTNPTLIAKETVEQAQQAFDVAQAVQTSSEAQVAQARAALDEARDNLARTRLFSPIAGRVVRLAVEEGEVAVPGTFSRETGLLMTIADLSTIVAKVQVDETDVVRLARGDSVEVTIDAFPDTTFVGEVTRIGNSAVLTTAAQAGASDQAVDFDVEVTLATPPEGIRPDLSCTARMVTETRSNVLSIPIIALTVRSHENVPSELNPDADTTPRAPGSRQEQETEGVFVVRDGIATFRPVTVGIAGEEHFEVLDGLRPGETIVSGTYQTIRDLQDGDKVTPAPAPAGAPSS